MLDGMVSALELGCAETGAIEVLSLSWQEVAKQNVYYYMNATANTTEQVKDSTVQVLKLFDILSHSFLLSCQVINLLSYDSFMSISKLFLCFMQANRNIGTINKFYFAKHVHF